MKSKGSLRGVNGRGPMEGLTRRFVCAHCGSTWVEPTGSVVPQEDKGRGELFLRFDMKSEICQTCRLQASDCQMCWLQDRECQKCGSKDVYEVRFAEEVAKVIC